MKTGYDQFFKKARENAGKGNPPPPSAKSRLTQTPKSTQMLVNELRTRVGQKKKVKKVKFAWRLTLMSFVGFVITATAYFQHEQIENWVKRIEITMIGSAYAETAPPAKDEKKAEKDAKEAKDVKEAKEAKDAKDEASGKKEYTDEELNHFAKLNDRKRELDAREEELNRLDAELQTQKVELEKRMQSLDKTRKEISTVLEERVQTDDKKVDTLVQMYSNMKPQQAAKVFEEMDEDLAVEIIGRMKKKNAAEIMNLMKPERAKLFTEKFAGYKRT